MIDAKTKEAFDSLPREAQVVWSEYFLATAAKRQAAQAVSMAEREIARTSGEHVKAIEREQRAWIAVQRVLDPEGKRPPLHLVAGGGVPGNDSNRGGGQ